MQLSQGGLAERRKKEAEKDARFESDWMELLAMAKGIELMEGGGGIFSRWALLRTAVVLDRNLGSVRLTWSAILVNSEAGDEAQGSSAGKKSQTSAPAATSPPEFIPLHAYILSTR